MQNPFNIIVLASGNGTNLQAVFDAMDAGKLRHVHVLGVISDKEDAGALEKARRYKDSWLEHCEQEISAIFIDPKGKIREEYDEELAVAVEKASEHVVTFSEFRHDRHFGHFNIDAICLMGYMKILSPKFIKKFKGKIINVHPSLLPKYGGKGMYGDHVHKAVLEAGEKESGMTIHCVDEGVDTGEIILQKKVQIEEGETVESLRKKVQAAEKEGYIEVLKRLSKVK